MSRPDRRSAASPESRSPALIRSDITFDGWLVQTITHLPAGRSLDALVALFTELPRTQGVSCPDPWSYIGRAGRCGSRRPDGR